MAAATGRRRPSTFALVGATGKWNVRGRLRVEAEWFHRESAYDQTSPVTSATGDTFAKLDGEIQRAEDRIGSISSQNVFANAYIDFPGRSRVTPYVGAGVGIGLTALDYGDLWARNPNPAVIGTAAGLPNEAEIRRNLAATTTSKQAELHDRLTGYQVLGGVDYAMSDAVSLGIKGRWVRFGRGKTWQSWASTPTPSSCSCRSRNRKPGRGNAGG